MKAPMPEALQSLLSEARGRIDPVGLGLERPRDRRGHQSPGLTQSQMDTLLRCRHGTYHAFERGTRTQPGDFLERLARVLQLTAHQWESLWLFAVGHAPPFPLDPDSGLDVPPVWKNVVHQLSTMAYISNVAWELLEYNDKFTEMFPHRRPPQNIMRWMLLHEEARSRVLLDWEDSWAAMVMPQLVAARSAHPENPTLLQLERDVLADTLAGPIYRSGTAAYSHPDGDDRPLIHAKLGSGQARLGAAEPRSSPGARLMVVEFVPDEPPVP